MTPPTGARGGSTPVPHRSYLPSLQGPPVDLNGHEIVVVFNPAARDGSIGQELPQLRQILEGYGAKVHLVETLPEEAARRERIQSAVAQVLEGTPLPEGRPSPVRQNLPNILILPYGGDGTIWETVGEVLKGSGISLGPHQSIEDLTLRLRAQMAFVLAKKGTASDNAVQMRAPTRARSLPRYITRSVELPYWFPIIETPTPEGPRYEVAGHSYSLGVGGFLFSQRESRRAENPKGFWNQGLRSYLALIPSATLNRYGWLGVDVDVKHFDAQGREKLATRLRGSEVIVSPNRIIAGVGGVPGGWGDTKMVILPPGPRGLLALGEFIFRGVATKLGWNLVGLQNRLRTLPAERQLRIWPGERIEVRTMVPDNFSWDILRLGQETFNGSRTAQGLYKWLGFGRPGPAIPAAGEPLTVPAQRNGDVVEPQSQFTVRSSGFAVSFLAHPDSLGVHLARSSALADRSVPLVSDQQLVAHVVSENAPRALELLPRLARARTPFVSQPRMQELLTRSEHTVPLEFTPELMLAARGVSDPAQISRLAHRDLSVESMQRFLSSDAGRVWRETYGSEARALGRRLVGQGVPLGLGIGSVFGAEALADVMGLDPVADRELRFGMSVYFAHAVQANATPLWEAYANRQLFHRPFDYLRTRQVRVAGEVLHQYEFFRHARGSEALYGSWRTGALALGGSQTLLSRALRFSLLPVRAAWNMGHGLMFSRLAESLVRDMPEDSWLRNYGPTLAFFAPDAGAILAPRMAERLLGNRPMGAAGRIFAGAFIADMTYSGVSHLAYGGEAAFQHQINMHAAQLRRERGDASLWRDALRFLAPGLSAHVDSHEYLFGSPNSYRREILMEGREWTSRVERELREEVPALIQYTGEDWDQALGRQVQLNPLESDIREQLSLFFRDTGTAGGTSRGDVVAWLQREFSGHDLSRSQVERALVRIRLRNFQDSVAAAMALGGARSSDLAVFFDERGRLLPGQGRHLEEHLRRESRQLLDFAAPLQDLASGASLGIMPS